ncbi:sialidase family protein [Paenibacillus radicis (ex Xue et al. 2023)]|uniref:Exo-alpha-sialidase n=1 Tax=Paenibacillus radicis (ex Xue et al. 2023) TaxID=2972489 RepID=A0ABT1YR84_9BACL|nr:sialidase family protein [Paenibacillus radicis (ex Xue et al. 2023)]MCR8635695.1 exo-alpha-sialidase [Paenibacillus radicis (ex Xue et al. 2023)]
MKLREQVKQFLFEEERPFNNCHASTVIAWPNGDLLVSYFAGTKEGNPDVAIWCSKRTDGVWSKPYLVADEEGLVHWNPVLFRKDDGQIVLHYKVGRPIPEWYTRVTVSNDDGATWSEPVDLVPGDVGGRGPVKNKLIVLQDGTWLAPASIEGEVWDCFADISYDQGLTWTRSELVPTNHGTELQSGSGAAMQQVHGKGLIQPTLWESKPGQVHMLMRSTGGFIYRSDSSDSGKTWSPAYRTYLPNNNSGIDLAKMDDGTLVLAYNPVGMYRGPRMPLLLSISKDNGEFWEELLVMEAEYRSYTIPIEPGEYSYPAVIAEGKHIYVTYTWKRERIVCWSLEVETAE